MSCVVASSKTDTEASGFRIPCPNTACMPGRCCKHAQILMITGDVCRKKCASSIHGLRLYLRQRRRRMVPAARFLQNPAQPLWVDCSSSRELPVRHCSIRFECPASTLAAVKTQPVVYKPVDCRQNRQAPVSAHLSFNELRCVVQPEREDQVIESAYYCRQPGCQKSRHGCQGALPPVRLPRRQNSMGK